MDKNIRYFTELYRILLIITREVTIFLRDKMKNDLRWRNHLPVSISDNDTIEDLDLNTLLFILERFAHEWFRENKLKEIKSTSYNIRIIRNELSHLNYKSLVMKLNFLPVYFETQKIFLNRIGSKSYSEIQNFIQDQKIKEIDYKKIELPIYRKNEENADIYTADWLQALIDSEQHRNSLYFNFTDFLDINFGADNLVPAQKYNLIYVGSTKNHIYDRMPMIQQLNFYLQFYQILT